jgi:ferredoxin
MRITVDWDLCESNALCMATAPHIFEVGDDDMLTVLVESPNPADRPLVEQAVASCPKQALRIID